MRIYDVYMTVDWWIIFFSQLILRYFLVEKNKRRALSHFLFSLRPVEQNWQLLKIKGKQEKEKRRKEGKKKGEKAREFVNLFLILNSNFPSCFLPSSQSLGFFFFFFLNKTKISLKPIFSLGKNFYNWTFLPFCLLSKYSD